MKKTCTRCKTEKDINDFCKKKANKDGYSGKFYNCS